MMDTNNKQRSKELEDLERKITQQRIKTRNEREARKKLDNRWKFEAGSLVATYLKDMLNIQVYNGPGAAAKNADSFQPLERILVYLAEHKELVVQILKEADQTSPETLQV